MIDAGPLTSRLYHFVSFSLPFSNDVLDLSYVYVGFEILWTCCMLSDVSKPDYYLFTSPSFLSFSLLHPLPSSITWTYQVLSFASMFQAALRRLGV